jgi:hypothetical protein
VQKIDDSPIINSPEIFIYTMIYRKKMVSFIRNVVCDVYILYNNKADLEKEGKSCPKTGKYPLVSNIEEVYQFGAGFALLRHICLNSACRYQKN